MIERAKLYKDISLEIIDLLSKEEINRIEELLDKRQDILNEENDYDGFKKFLIDNGILDIDKDIHRLLNENIYKVKSEIREHRLSQQANNSYINSNRKKLNIFNEKV